MVSTENSEEPPTARDRTASAPDHEPGLDRAADEFHRVAGAELGHELVAVGLHGAGTDPELVGDLRRRLASGPVP